MTLVMSTSVVGISIDYALHYLTERLIHGDEESGLTSMKKLFPALVLAVLSSAVAYLLLFIAPFLDYSSWLFLPPPGSAVHS